MEPIACQASSGPSNWRRESDCGTRLLQRQIRGVAAMAPRLLFAIRIAISCSAKPAISFSLDFLPRGMTRSADFMCSIRLGNASVAKWSGHIRHLPTAAVTREMTKNLSAFHWPGDCVRLTRSPIEMQARFAFSPTTKPRWIQGSITWSQDPIRGLCNSWERAARHRG